MHCLESTACPNNRKTYYVEYNDSWGCVSLLLKDWIQLEHLCLIIEDKVQHDCIWLESLKIGMMWDNSPG